MNNMKYGIIYKITNKLNGKSYIGLTTTNLKTRMKNHFREKKHISNVLKKYKEHCVVEEICSTTNLIDLNYLETYFINHYNTFYPNGYNHTKGGDSKGSISEVTRQKLINSHLGQVSKNKGKIKSHNEIYNNSKKQILIATNLKNQKQKIFFTYQSEVELYGFNVQSVTQQLKGKRKHVNYWFFEKFNNANQSGSKEEISLHAQRLEDETENVNNSSTSPEIPNNYRGKIDTHTLKIKYEELSKSWYKTAIYFNMIPVTVYQRLKRNNLL